MPRTRILARVQRWWPVATVGLGLAAVALLLGLPSPVRSSAGSSRVPAQAGAPSGQVLSSVWPAARPFTFSGVLPDGSAYVPAVVLDATTSVGRATSPDQSRVSLVVLTGGIGRVVQTALIDQGGLIDGITVAQDTEIYWMLTTPDMAGRVSTGLWSAAVSGGPARLVTADVGLPTLDGSKYGLQVVNGRLWWASTSSPDQTDRTELRSIALAGGLAGGPVSVRTIPGAWTMSRWPWLVTSPAAVSAGIPVRRYDATTDATQIVAVAAGTSVECGPVWCVTAPGDTVTLFHPDGSDTRRISTGRTLPALVDVALADRFEPLLAPASANPDSGLTVLRLYDTVTGRTALVDRGVNQVGGDEDFLWWATGDSEAVAWHAVDLRTLTP